MDSMVSDKLWFACVQKHTAVRVPRLVERHIEHHISASLVGVACEQRLLS